MPKKEVKKFPKQIPKKCLIILISVIFILIISVICLTDFIKENFSEKIPACGDGTLYEKCSSRKPYFCSNGTLVEKASVCKCPDVLTKQEELCVSKYQTNPKNITLKYILRGEEKEINYVVYGGMMDYISALPNSIYSANGEKPSRGDFKIRNLDEQEQKELLLPLVTEIQNTAEDKLEQMRIAVSIVQKIPFGNSNKTISVGPNQEITYSRYPYEVLYEMRGVCGEKSELLGFLLRELGYGIVFFHYSLENHEALGIKCPEKFGVGETGYCFVETTGPSIISNNKIEYAEALKLSSEPELILFLDGDSLGKNLYEYEDAKDLIKINKAIEEKGQINFFQNRKLQELKEKYGLEEL